jgi:hypothetical protein
LEALKAVKRRLVLRPLQHVEPSGDTGEVYCLNLIHVVAMWKSGQITKVRLSDRVEMEVKESPDDLLATANQAAAPERGE